MHKYIKVKGGVYCYLPFWEMRANHQKGMKLHKSAPTAPTYRSKCKDQLNNVFIYFFIEGFWCNVEKSASPCDVILL